jgi:hypothetical protein
MALGPRRAIVVEGFRSTHFRSSRYRFGHCRRRSPPGKTLVAETLIVGWRCAKKACVVLMMPILCSRVSAGIRHNIAQDCQEPSVIAEQNNTCVPA